LCTHVGRWCKPDSLGHGAGCAWALRAGRRLDDVARWSRLQRLCASAQAVADMCASNRAQPRRADGCTRLRRQVHVNAGNHREVAVRTHNSTLCSGDACVAAPTSGTPDVVTASIGAYCVSYTQHQVQNATGVCRWYVLHCALCRAVLSAIAPCSRECNAYHTPAMPFCCCMS
jgi:hypothetical protein